MPCCRASSLGSCCGGKPFWREVWASNVKAARANVLPGLFVQAISLTVVLLYFLVPGSRFAFDSITALGAQFGLGFSIFGTSLFGGIIPFVVLLAMGRVPRDHWDVVKHGLFAVIFWAWKGFEFGLFYHLQAMLFGESADPGTVACKVATMIFVATPLYFNVENALCFMWKEAGFPGPRRYFRQLKGRTLALTCVSSLLGCFLVWIPVYAFVYSLPEPLEIPVQNLVLVFWSLMYSTVVKASGTAATTTTSANAEDYVDVEAQCLHENEPGKPSCVVAASAPKEAECGLNEQDGGVSETVPSPAVAIAGVTPETSSLGVDPCKAPCTSTPPSPSKAPQIEGPVSGYAPLVEDMV